MLRPYPEDGPWAGRLSKMRIVKAEIQEHLTAKDKPPVMLALIDEAVARIMAGTYDFCSGCGKKLVEDRVRVESPWITRCAACRVKK